MRSPLYKNRDKTDNMEEMKAGSTAKSRMSMMLDGEENGEDKYNIVDADGTVKVVDTETDQPITERNELGTATNSVALMDSVDYGID